MKYYLSDILPRLKKFSVTLDQSAFLLDKPWVVSGSNPSYDKLIFRRDGRVHLSSNGNVTTGNWEYLPEAQSLLIDYGDTQKLYRHQYLDSAVLALKIDGPLNGGEYFLLANETIIPDANAERYLRYKYLKENNIKLLLLDDGTEIEMHQGNPEVGERKKLLKDGYKLNDGEYYLKNGRIKLKVKNENFTMLKKIQYDTDVFIWQKNKILPTIGEEVEGLEAGSLIFKNPTRYEIKIVNGKVDEITNLTAKTAMRVIFIAIIILFSAAVFGSVIS